MIMTNAVMETTEHLIAIRGRKAAPWKGIRFFSMSELEDFLDKNNIDREKINIKEKRVKASGTPGAPTKDDIVVMEFIPVWKYEAKGTPVPDEVLERYRAQKAMDEANKSSQVSIIDIMGNMKRMDNMTNTLNGIDDPGSMKSKGKKGNT